MKTSLTFSIALVAGFAAMATAKADTFTESVQFGPGPTDFSSTTGTTAGPGGNSLYYFDSNGGTLNSITFSYSYAFSSRITLTNNSSGTASGSVFTESGAQFSSTSTAITAALNHFVNTNTNGLSFGATTLAPVAYDIRGNGSSYSLAQGSSQVYTSQGNGSTSFMTDTNLSDLAAFSKAGGGTFVPLFSTLTGLMLTNSSGSNVSASAVTTAQGNLVLSYNYTLGAPPPPTPASVPETGSTVALFGVGLIGLGAFRKLQRTAFGLC